ncbi:M23 family metallopeptidase [Streptomyces sp. NPDC101118]|uniref:M23 family metallopeptidase n=1 Tax=Streptomyces sp. NPDC101118 TaxID=3366109 RepID=UPI0037F6FDB1
MNDRPSSGHYPHAGYDGLSTSTFAGDPLFGSLDSGYGTQQAAYPSYEYDPYGAYGAQQPHEAYGTQDTAYATGYDAGQSGHYDATAWTSQESYLGAIPAQLTPDDTTGQWDANAWQTAHQQQPEPFAYDPSGQHSGHWATPGSETGTYDATAWNGGYEPAYDTTTAAYDATATAYDTSADPYAQQQYPEHQPAQQYDATQTYVDLSTYSEYSEPTPAAPPAPESEGPAVEGPSADQVAFAAAATMVGEIELDFDFEAEDPAPEAADTIPETVTPAPRAARRAAAAQSGSRGRRRTPAKRSALLTVAVPSACVMGVAGVAAASVGGLTGQAPVEETKTLSAPDPASVKPVAANSKLDTQLAALSADAGDFADRASRTQERIDLRERAEQERKKRAEEAARKEALRPKFALPVARHGLSAMYGQSGVNWMSLHTGIDFPVSYGTPVMAATDGTVRTQWNSAYGNMAIVTAPDGTETWYCHLSSTRFRSGTVKAGDVIAYSGNSGNSTGPHLHFEVRPGGGASINPLTWLRSHGLDPT